MLKKHFRILRLAPEYSLEVQARIPAALCAIHNFIRIHDPAEDTVLAADNDNDYDDNTALDRDHEAFAAAAAENDTMSAKRDSIAQAMWDDYLEICQERGFGSDDSDSGDESMAEVDDMLE